MGHRKPISEQQTPLLQPLFKQFPIQINREIISRNREFLAVNREFCLQTGKRPFLTRLCLRGSNAICSHRQILKVRTREPKLSCLSSFGSLRASFPKLYQRRIMRPNDAAAQISTNVRFAPKAVIRNLISFYAKAFGLQKAGIQSAVAKHDSHDLLASGSIIPRAREGHRRRFSERDKRQIFEETMQPGARLSEVGRCYGIAARVPFRWKQELKSSAAPMFVAVEITDPALSDRGCAS